MGLRPARVGNTIIQLDNESVIPIKVRISTMKVTWGFVINYHCCPNVLMM